MIDPPDRRRAHVQPACPIRSGERCNLCQVNVTGPHDCGLVYLVMSDPELRAMYDEQGRRYRKVGGQGGTEAPSD